MGISLDIGQEVADNELWEAFEEAAKKTGAQIKKEDLKVNIPVKSVQENSAEKRLHLKSLANETAKDETPQDETVANSHQNQQYKVAVVMPVEESKGFFVKTRAIFCETVLASGQYYKEIELAISESYRFTWRLPIASLLLLIGGGVSIAMLVLGAPDPVVIASVWAFMGAGVLWAHLARTQDISLDSPHFKTVQPHLTEYLEEVSKALDSSSILDSSETKPRLLAG